ncbi:MAG: ATP-grasp domain-containing protein [Steroidobacter sp.]
MASAREANTSRSEPVRILVTDSDNRSALAATRSLGRAGYKVFTAGESHPSLASVSRYSVGFSEYCSPNRSPEEFVRDVADIVERHHIDVLLPMTEITTLLLTQHRSLLPPEVRMPFPDAATVAAVADKSQVLQQAERIGVPIPRTLVVASAQDARDKASQIQYPAVFKPARSRNWNGKNWVSSSTGYAAQAEDLFSRLDRLDPAVFPVLIQERIVGPGVGVFVCCDSTDVLATFSHRRIREKPPSGGVSVLCESALVDPVAKKQAIALLKAMGWRGVAMVEFKQNSRDGSLRLMEINGRFWGSLQLAIDAGVDFPALAVDVALDRKRAALESYRVGTRSRWLWGDVDAMLALLFRSRQQLNLPDSHPGRWRTLLSFLQPWGTRYELERADDPKPAMLAAKRWLLRR